MVNPLLSSPGGLSILSPFEGRLEGRGAYLRGALINSRKDNAIGSP